MEIKKELITRNIELVFDVDRREDGVKINAYLDGKLMLSSHFSNTLLTDLNTFHGVNAIDECITSMVEELRVRFKK